MTRYRLKTVRALEITLFEKGPMTPGELADLTGKDLRVVRNYLNRHPAVFRRVGRGTWGTVTKTDPSRGL